MIQTEPEDVERIRERLRKMSDLELRRYARAARDLSNPKKDFAPPNPSLQVQLDEAHAEWRRRHPPNMEARINRLPELWKDARDGA
jgi:hypothetical protein